MKTPTITSFNPQELKHKVKEMYKAVAEYPEVTYHFEMGRQLAERLGYPLDELDELPVGAVNSFAGVGYYFDLAELEVGEIVADLGSGSGMDAFFAAKQVGSIGRVIGIDMTTEQLRKAEHLRWKDRFHQVEFQQAYIEKLPLADNCIDVVISNGVINLSVDKAKVFQEIARVLKPGGRLALADIVSSVELPESISCNVSLWASYIGGAIEVSSYQSLIEAAGLEVLEIKENPYAFISRSAQGATRDYGIKSISLLAVKRGMEN
jgi:SAM-dependent methyltransferase